MPRMQGSDLYEWMRKFVTEGIVNHPHLGINFVIRFVRPPLEKSFSYPMIPNVRGSVTGYGKNKKIIQEDISGRLIGPGRSQG